MSVHDFLKRVAAIGKVLFDAGFPHPPAPEPVQEDDTHYHPYTYDLLELLEEYLLESRKSVGLTGGIHEGEMKIFRSLVPVLRPETALAIIRTTKEYKDYDPVLSLRKFSNSSRWDENELRNEAVFHGVMREHRNGWFYFEEALNRLRQADPEFAYCDFATLDDSSRQHAIALFRVIMHFIEYKGETSPDTSRFLREHPEMADRVIAFIENRGIGIGSFSIEVFAMAEENGVHVLDSGVL